MKKNLVKKTDYGFTLVEMVVVVSIVAIISAALFANYREIGDQGRVTAYAGKLREDVHLAQQYAYSGRSNKWNIPNGWGIYFNRNLNKYVIFADLNNSRTYDYPTKLLIHGTEWSSGPSFTDSAVAANSVSIVGNAAQTAGSWPPVFGSGYWQFDGSNGKLSVPDNANFDFGSGNFAIDAWIYADSVGSKKYILSKGTPSKVFELYKDSDDLIKFTIYDGSAVAYTVSSTLGALSASTTYHLAVTRVSNILNLFVNGIPASTTRMTAAARQTATSVIIGADSDGLSGFWPGRIGEIRISKGAGRWWEKFSVPAAKYATDDEFFREIKLPPGLVFDSLTVNNAATSEMSLFFDPVTYLTYVYSSSTVATLQSAVILNNAGVAGTSLAGDTPNTLTVATSGLINWTH